MIMRPAELDDAKNQFSTEHPSILASSASPPVSLKIARAGCFVRAAVMAGPLCRIKPWGQPDAWRMIRKPAAAAGIAEEIGCRTFRATGITAYLANGDALEHAQEMAAHESPRMTKLYDRTKQRLTQDES
jgi:hypothetical protein